MAGSPDHVIATLCPYCGVEGHALFGETVQDGQLRWYRSISACPEVGFVEEDGTGEAPAALRHQLLSIKGTWSIRVNSPNRVRVLQIAKRARNLDQSAALAYLRDFPLITVGTRAEADWLMAVLRTHEIDAEIWGVRFVLKDPADGPLPDASSALAMLKAKDIDPDRVEEVSLFWDGSMSVILNHNGELSHLGIEFDPEFCFSLAAAFIALGVPVQRVDAD